MSLEWRETKRYRRLENDNMLPSLLVFELASYNIVYKFGMNAITKLMILYRYCSHIVTLQLVVAMCLTDSIQAALSL